MSYIPTTWQDGDAITANKLNKIQQAVEARAVNPFLGSSFTAAQVKQILDLGMIPVITQYIQTNNGSNNSQKKETKKLALKEDDSSTTLIQTFDYIIELDESSDEVIVTTLQGAIWVTNSQNSPMEKQDETSWNPGPITDDPGVVVVK